MIKSLKTKFVFLAAIAIFFTIIFPDRSAAQVPTYHFDEGQLSLSVGGSLVSDPTAKGGTAMFRSTSSGNNTFWYGPYNHIPAGNYIMQVRLKVSSNQVDSRLLTLDVNNGANGYVFASLPIKPNMFKTSNEWQIFSFPFQIPESGTMTELRGVGFQSGLTDIYMDYVNIVPDDSKGIYSDDLTIDGNGNVGIHTATPKEALSVNGNIRAREVKVEIANWPDYVFDTDYSLTSLKAIASFISINKHLPGIPTDLEVRRNGLELGEMNKLLTKKVEELTLYLIEQDKTNQIQQDQINALTKEVNLLIKKNQSNQPTD